MMVTKESRRAEYQKYMRSRKWRNTRKDLFKLRGEVCEECGRLPSMFRSLQVHHLTYERFGDELPSDLRILCVPCHEWADERRCNELSEQRMISSEERRREAAFETWSVNRYGYVATRDEEREDFDEWWDGLEG